MAQKDRETLKYHFRSGRMPSQEEFGDLIDSMLNIIDEGFDKSAEDGFKVSQLTGSGRLISFFKNISVQDPVWFMKIDWQTETLTFGNEDNQAVLSLPHKKSEDQEPEWELDVDGVIRAKGRMGFADKTVPADGQWHDITETLSGCHALEIMAGAGGKERDGRYTLMRAFAMNTFDPRGMFFNFLNAKKRINYHHAYYRSRSDKLKLRWKNEAGHDYRLQLRSNSNYGDGIQIKYYITKLWFDAEMSASRVQIDNEG